MTDSQVNTLLSGVLAAMTTKWIIFGVMLGVGVIILVVSILLLVKARKLSHAHSHYANEEGFESASGENLKASIGESIDGDD